MNKIATFMRDSGTARFLIPVGLILTIFGVFMFVVTSNTQNYIEIKATVSNVELAEKIAAEDENETPDTYNVTVKYTVDSKEYEATLDNVSKFNVGDETTIYYNPKDPSQITQSKSYILPVVMIAGGIASFIGGIISAVNAVKKHEKMKEQERSWENE